MNIRDLPSNIIRKLAIEGDETYQEWLDTTHGVAFGTQTPVTQKELWRLAFSKGCSAVLRRTDKLEKQ